MNFELNLSNVKGLPKAEQAMLNELTKSFQAHQTANRKKCKYYEGNISLGDVNLGIALPEGMQGLEIGCAWGAKCVDVLAARSMFDGYVGANGEISEDMEQIVVGNRLIEAYQRSCRDELKLGATFATLSKDSKLGCKIRFHSAQTATARWNGNKGRIDCGFAIIDTQPDNAPNPTWTPSLIYFYTDGAVWVLQRSQYVWTATEFRHRMGRPLMEPMVFNATSEKPFGRSRIKEPVRRLIDGYVRTIANATIGLEFATAPQKYLLGITDEQYETIINQKFRQYVGSIIAATNNPESGDSPAFGQLPQGSITPHVDMLRLLATQFGAATGLSVTDTGVVNDANPTSSEAIIAQTQTLIGMAEQLNVGNGNALRTIAQMALAVKHDCRVEDLSDEQRDTIAHFKNPAMPSVAVTADAAIKIASSRPTFAQTDTFLEMLGFDQADVRRIKAQEQRARGLALVESLQSEAMPTGTLTEAE